MKRKGNGTRPESSNIAGQPSTRDKKLAAKSHASPVSESAGTFPIVGIGASAGGLAAFEAFFSGMPADSDPNMAFVLVQHLAPDHKSILTELVKRYTRLEVFEVEDGMKVRPNCAYIIPPNRDMALMNGTLELLEPVAPRGRRLPIDFFFGSLAQDQRERSICVILSGTGSDGSLGLRAIKGEGGLVMVQSPESTEYDGMPRSAIATGLVDFELPPAAMPAQIIAYASHISGTPAMQRSEQAPKAESVLKKVYLMLRAQTGHDFTLYKQNTLIRRIERRMAVNQIAVLDDYVRYLQSSPPEVEALFRDLLIGVTNFFRDTEAFEALGQKALPRILASKAPGSSIRVWVPGCSTGEEAYSIAILLRESLTAQNLDVNIQVFATDIDSRAIDHARRNLPVEHLVRRDARPACQVLHA
jgi:two-component system, chemotaxis family, CheB/CheR fusion protein